MSPLGKPTCGTCRACCHDCVVMLHPEDGDDIRSYKAEVVEHPTSGEEIIALQRNPDGTCVYLGDNGCTIHSRAPAACRSFDCRHFYWFLVNNTSRNERQRLVKEGYIQASTLRAGRQRYATLDASELDRQFVKVYYGQDVFDLLAKRSRR